MEDRGEASREAIVTVVTVVDKVLCIAKSPTGRSLAIAATIRWERVAQVVVARRGSGDGGSRDGARSSSSFSFFLLHLLFFTSSHPHNTPIAGRQMEEY